MEISYAFFYGTLTGIVLSLMLGTVFFALIQSSIDNGYKSGFFIATGVVLTDIFFISVAIFGTKYIPKINHIELYASLLGCILLFSLGLVSIFKQQSQLVYPQTKFGNVLYYITSGSLLNLLNPVNFFAWTTIVAGLRTSQNFSENQIIAFFVGCLVSIFSMEIVISYFASKLKKVFTLEVLKRINQITGIVFVLCGLKLLYDVLFVYLKS